MHYQRVRRRLAGVVDNTTVQHHDAFLDILTARDVEWAGVDDCFTFAPSKPQEGHP